MPDLYPHQVKAKLLSSRYMQTSNIRPQSLGFNMGVREKQKYKQAIISFASQQTDK